MGDAPRRDGREARDFSKDVDADTAGEPSRVSLVMVGIVSVSSAEDNRGGPRPE